MTRIKIFLASSSELKYERLILSPLVLDLNEQLRAQQRQIELVKWEHMDPAMGILHKQEEYDIALCECGICIVMYHTTLGEFTLREFRIARAQMEAGLLPRRVELWFKQSDKAMDDDLADFRQQVEQEMPVRSFQNRKELEALFHSLELATG